MTDNDFPVLTLAPKWEEMALQVMDRLTISPEWAEFNRVILRTRKHMYYCGAQAVLACLADGADIAALVTEVLTELEKSTDWEY